MKSFKPDLLLVPYGWSVTVGDCPKAENDLKDRVYIASLTVNCPLIGSDSVGEITHGPAFGSTYCGASVIADAKNNIVKVGKDRDVDIVIHTLHL